MALGSGGALGTLTLYIKADTTNIDRAIASMEQKMRNYGSDMTALSNTFSLKPNVDDSALTALNEHLSLKEAHFKSVQKLFDSSPLKPKVDLSELKELSSELDKIDNIKTLKQTLAANTLKPTVDTSDLDRLQSELKSSAVIANTGFNIEPKVNSRNLNKMRKEIADLRRSAKQLNATEVGFGSSKNRVSDNVIPTTLKNATTRISSGSNVSTSSNSPISITVTPRNLLSAVQNANKAESARPASDSSIAPLTGTRALKSLATSLNKLRLSNDSPELQISRNTKINPYLKTLIKENKQPSLGVEYQIANQALKQSIQKTVFQVGKFTINQAQIQVKQALNQTTSKTDVSSSRIGDSRVASGTEVVTARQVINEGLEKLEEKKSPQVETVKSRDSDNDNGAVDAVGGIAERALQMVIQQAFSGFNPASILLSILGVGFAKDIGQGIVTTLTSKLGNVFDLVASQTIGIVSNTIGQYVNPMNLAFAVLVPGLTALGGVLGGMVLRGSAVNTVFETLTKVAGFGMDNASKVPGAIGGAFKIQDSVAKAFGRSAGEEISKTQKQGGGILGFFQKTLGSIFRGLTENIGARISSGLIKGVEAQFGFKLQEVVADAVQKGIREGVKAFDYMKGAVSGFIGDHNPFGQRRLTNTPIAGLLLPDVEEQIRLAGRNAQRTARRATRGAKKWINNNFGNANNNPPDINPLRQEFEQGLANTGEIFSLEAVSSLFGGVISSIQNAVSTLLDKMKVFFEAIRKGIEDITDSFAGLEKINELPGVKRFTAKNGSRNYSVQTNAGEKLDVGFNHITDDESSVAFKVGNSFSKKEDLTEKEKNEIALKVLKIIQHDASTRPDQYQYKTKAHGGDGYGAARAIAYERIGQFSRPLGGNPGQYQFAVVDNQKIHPDNNRLQTLESGQWSQREIDINVKRALAEAARERQKITKQQQLNFAAFVSSSAKISGVSSLSQKALPKLALDDKRLSDAGAKAMYDVKNNTVVISNAIAKLLEKAPEDLEFFADNYTEEIQHLIHEIRHAFQFDFGKLNYAEMAKGAQPGVLTPFSQTSEKAQEYAKAAADTDYYKQYAKQMPSGFLDVVRNTEADAVNFESRWKDVIQDIVQELNKVELSIDDNKLNENPEPVAYRFDPGAIASGAVTAGVAGVQVGASAAQYAASPVIQNFTDQLKKGQAHLNKILANPQLQQNFSQLQKEAGKLSGEIQELIEDVGDGTAQFQDLPDRFSELFERLERVSQQAANIPANLRPAPTLQERFGNAARSVQENAFGGFFDPKRATKPIGGDDFDFSPESIQKLLTSEEAAFGALQGAITGDWTDLFQEFYQAIDSFLDQAADSLIDFVEKIPGLGNFAGLLRGLKQFKAVAMSLVGLQLAFKGYQELSEVFRGIEEAFIQAALAAEKYERTLTFVLGSSDKAKNQIERLQKESARFGLDSAQTIAGYSQIAASSKETSLEGTGAEQISSALNQASGVYNLSGEEQGRVNTAVAQMISKNTVSAEELRQQLGEVLPGSFNIAARAAGKTTAEFNQMLESGQVLASDFLPKFAQQLSAETASGVVGAMNSSQAATNNFMSELQKFQVMMGKGLIPERNLGLKALTQGLRLLQDHAMTIGNVMGTLVFRQIFKLLGAFAVFASNLVKASFNLAGFAKGLTVVQAFLGTVTRVLINFGKQFIVFTLFFDMVQMLTKSWKNASGGLNNFVKTSQKGMTEYKNAVNEARKANQSFESSLPKKREDVRGESLLEDTFVGGILGKKGSRKLEDALVTSFNYNDKAKDRLTQYINPVKGIAYLLTGGKGVRRYAEKKLEDTGIASDEIMSGANESISQILSYRGSKKGGATLELRKVQDVDAQLRNVQAERRGLSRIDPGNIEAIKELQKQESELLKTREKAFKPLGILQAKLQGEIDGIKEALKQYDELALEGGVDQETYKTKTDALKSALKAAEKQQIEFNRAIGGAADNFTYLQRSLQGVVDKLAGADSKIKAITNSTKRTLLQAEGSGSITSGQSQFAQADLEKRAIEAQVKERQAAVAEMNGILSQLNVDKVLQANGIKNIGDVSAQELNTLADRSKDSPQDTEVFKRLAEVKGIEIEIDDLITQVEEKKLQAAQQIKDANKQIGDYFRDISRQSKELALTTKEAQAQIALQQQKNKLKSALQGFQDNFFSSFVDSLIEGMDSLNEPIMASIEKEREIQSANFAKEDRDRQTSDLYKSLPLQTQQIKLDFSGLDGAPIEKLKANLEGSADASDSITAAAKEIGAAIAGSTDEVSNFGSSVGDVASQVEGVKSSTDNVTMALQDNVSKAQEVDTQLQTNRQAIDDNRAATEGVSQAVTVQAQKILESMSATEQSTATTNILQQAWTGVVKTVSDTLAKTWEFFEGLAKNKDFVNQFGDMFNSWGKGVQFAIQKTWEFFEGLGKNIPFLQQIGQVIGGWGQQIGQAGQQAIASTQQAAGDLVQQAGNIWNKGVEAVKQVFGGNGKGVGKVGAYTIHESVGSRNLPVNNFRDIHKHHPSAGREGGNRQYGTIEGEFEEIRTTRDNRTLIKKDFILSKNGRSDVAVPSFAAGFAKVLNDATNTVQIYADRAMTKMLGQSLHMSNIAVKTGQEVKYGQTLGTQSNVYRGRKVGVHAHIEAELEQFKKYIQDLKDGTFEGVQGKEQAHHVGDGHNHYGEDDIKAANVKAAQVTMRRTGQKDDKGLEKIAIVATNNDGKVVYQGTVNSGKASMQNQFGGPGSTRSGSKAPLEYGRYTIGAPVAGKGAAVGKSFVPVNPQFQTERSSIGFHWDADRAVGAGSAGCIVFQTEAEFNAFKQAIAKNGINSLVFEDKTTSDRKPQTITGRQAQALMQSVGSLGDQVGRQASQNRNQPLGAQIQDYSNISSNKGAAGGYYKGFSQTIVDLIKKAEGFHTTAYRDTDGIATIGYGTRIRRSGRKVQFGDTIGRDEAEWALGQEMNKAKREVLERVTVPLNENQLSALVSFAFNGGGGMLDNTTLLQKLNSGDYSGAAGQFQRFNKAQGNGGRKVVMPGLTKRRLAEASLFMTPTNQKARATSAAAQQNPRITLMDMVDDLGGHVRQAAQAAPAAPPRPMLMPVPFASMTKTAATRPTVTQAKPKPAVATKPSTTAKPQTISPTSSIPKGPQYSSSKVDLAQLEAAQKKSEEIQRQQQQQAVVKEQARVEQARVDGEQRQRQRLEQLRQSLMEQSKNRTQLNRQFRDLGFDSQLQTPNIEAMRKRVGINDQFDDIKLANEEDIRKTTAGRDQAQRTLAKLTAPDYVAQPGQDVQKDIEGAKQAIASAEAYLKDLKRVQGEIETQRQSHLKFQSEQAEREKRLRQQQEKFGTEEVGLSVLEAEAQKLKGMHDRGIRDQGVENLPKLEATIAARREELSLKQKISEIDEKIRLNSDDPKIVSELNNQKAGMQTRLKLVNETIDANRKYAETVANRDNQRRAREQKSDLTRGGVDVLKQQLEATQQIASARPSSPEALKLPDMERNIALKEAELNLSERIAAVEDKRFSKDFTDQAADQRIGQLKREYAQQVLNINAKAKLAKEEAARQKTAAEREAKFGTDEASMSKLEAEVQRLEGLKSRGVQNQGVENLEKLKAALEIRREDINLKKQVVDLNEKIRQNKDNPTIVAELTKQKAILTDRLNIVKKNIDANRIYTEEIIRRENATANQQAKFATEEASFSKLEAEVQRLEGMKNRGTTDQGVQNLPKLKAALEIRREEMNLKRQLSELDDEMFRKQGNPIIVGELKKQKAILTDRLGIVKKNIEADRVYTEELIRRENEKTEQEARFGTEEANISNVEATVQKLEGMQKRGVRDQGVENLPKLKAALEIRKEEIQLQRQLRELDDKIFQNRGNKTVVAEFQKQKAALTQRLATVKENIEADRIFTEEMIRRDNERAEQEARFGTEEANISNVEATIQSLEGKQRRGVRGEGVENLPKLKAALEIRKEEMNLQRQLKDLDDKIFQNKGNKILVGEFEKQKVALTQRLATVKENIEADRVFTEEMIRRENAQAEAQAKAGTEEADISVVEARIQTLEGLERQGIRDQGVENLPKLKAQLEARREELQLKKQLQDLDDQMFKNQGNPTILAELDQQKQKLTERLGIVKQNIESNRVYTEEVIRRGNAQKDREAASEQTQAELAVQKQELARLQQLKSVNPEAAGTERIPELEEAVELKELELKLTNDLAAAEQARFENRITTDQGLQERVAAITAENKLAVENVRIKRQQAEAEAAAARARAAIANREQDLGVRGEVTEALVKNIEYGRSQGDVLSMRFSQQKAQQQLSFEKQMIDLDELEASGRRTKEEIDALREAYTQLNEISLDNLKTEQQRATEDRIMEISGRMMSSRNSLLGGKADLFGSMGLETQAKEYRKVAAINDQKQGFAQQSLELERFIAQMQLSNEQAMELRMNLGAVNNMKLDQIENEFSVMNEITTGIKSSFQGAFESVLNGSKSIGEAALDFLKGIGDKLASMAAQMISDELFGKILGKGNKKDAAKDAAAIGSGGFLGGQNPLDQYSMMNPLPVVLAGGGSLGGMLPGGFGDGNSFMDGVLGGQGSFFGENLFGNSPLPVNMVQANDSIFSSLTDGILGIFGGGGGGDPLGGLLGLGMNLLGGGGGGFGAGGSDGLGLLSIIPSMLGMFAEGGEVGKAIHTQNLARGGTVGCGCSACAMARGGVAGSGIEESLEAAIKRERSMNGGKRAHVIVATAGELVVPTKVADRLSPKMKDFLIGKSGAPGASKMNYAAGGIVGQVSGGISNTVQNMNGSTSIGGATVNVNGDSGSMSREEAIRLQKLIDARVMDVVSKSKRPRGLLY